MFRDLIRFSCEPSISEKKVTHHHYSKHRDSLKDRKNHCFDLFRFDLPNTKLRCNADNLYCIADHPKCIADNCPNNCYPVVLAPGLTTNPSYYHPVKILENLSILCDRLRYPGFRRSPIEPSRWDR